MDSDEAIRNAVKMVFPNADISQCINNIRQNIKKALKKFSITKAKKAKILYEIFGSIKKGREKSLIMSKNEKVFFQRYKRKSKNWDFKKNGKKNFHLKPKNILFNKIFKKIKPFYCILFYLLS